MLITIPSMKHRDVLKLYNMIQWKGEITYSVKYILHDDYDNSDKGNLSIIHITIEAHTEDFNDVVKLLNSKSHQVLSISISLTNVDPEGYSVYTRYEIDILASELNIRRPGEKNFWAPEALKKQGFSFGRGGIRCIKIDYE